MTMVSAMQGRGEEKAFKEGADLSRQFALLPPADYRLLELISNSSGVPCFICAPHRTGRTSLALDYAQRHHHIEEVLWINAAADGFKEALENGSMFECIDRQISNGLSRYSLIVIDDLPMLSERTTSRFSNWIDLLLEEEREVIVITTPQEDYLENFQSDRVYIGGQKLVLAQKWSTPRMTECLRSFFAEPIQKEIQILAALMIMMGRGIVDNLRELQYQIPENSHISLRQQCPLIEIDEFTGYFNAQGFPIQQLTEQLIALVNQAPRSDSDRQVPEIERSFERLTQMSAHLFERGERAQSQLLLELAGSLLTCEDADINLSAATEELARSREGTHTKSVAAYRGRIRTHDPIQVLRGRMTRFDATAEYLSKDDSEQLVIRLFGDFKVLKSGEPVEGKQLQRSKVRCLLIHLALNMGRGVARDTLLERIWPGKDYEHAKDNFYSTWSMLNSLLSDKQKDNPYLSSKQGLCRLEPAHVITDVFEFERLSKAVLFQLGTVGERIEAIFHIEQLYRGDIMSGTRIDTYVQAAQDRYRSILVDVMIEASKLFSSEGNDTNAVWFARKAYDIDPTREDVYRTLMSMQDRAGQRTSALRTYFDCKRFLSEELGILPSQKTMALYQELLLDRR